MTDIHEKIGELRGELKGIVEQQNRTNASISDIFSEMKENHKELTAAIAKSSAHKCEKEQVFEQMAQRCETAVVQAAKVHADTKPLLDEYERKKQSRMRRLAERSDVKVALVVAFIVWVGGNLKDAVSWVYYIFTK